jgi:hypothetical protein
MELRRRDVPVKPDPTSALINEVDEVFAEGSVNRITTIADYKVSKS